MGSPHCPPSSYCPALRGRSSGTETMLNTICIICIKKIPNKHLLTVKGNCYLRATAVCNYKQILLKSNYKYIKISNYLLICLQCKHGFLHPYSCFKFRKHVLERPGVYNKSMPQLSTVEFSESGTFFTWQDHVS